MQGGMADPFCLTARHVTENLNLDVRVPPSARAPPRGCCRRAPTGACRTLLTGLFSRCKFKCQMHPYNTWYRTKRFNTISAPQVFSPAVGPARSAPSALCAPRALRFPTRRASRCGRCSTTSLITASHGTRGGCLPRTRLGAPTSCAWARSLPPWCAPPSSAAPPMRRRAECFGPWGVRRRRIRLGPPHFCGGQQVFARL